MCDESGCSSVPPMEHGPAGHGLYRAGGAEGSTSSVASGTTTGESRPRWDGPCAAFRDVRARVGYPKNRRQSQTANSMAATSAMSPAGSACRVLLTPTAPKYTAIT